MKLLFLSFLCFAFAAAAKLPNGLKRCNLKDKPCLQDAIQDSIGKMVNGVPEFGIPRIDPMVIPKLTIGAGHKVIQLEQNYINLTLIGFGRNKLIDFNIDLEKGEISLESTFDEQIMTGTYKMDGKVLLLPVHGQGTFTIKLEKGDSKLKFDIELFTKNNQKHIKGTKASMVTTVQKASFKFDNIFDGNKELGDNINNVLNENWKDVLDEMAPAYSEAIAQVLMADMNRLFDKVPISEVFLDQ